MGVLWLPFIIFGGMNMGVKTMSRIANHMDKIINVRSYEDTPIKEEIIEELLHAFSLGPSLANLQPWETIIMATEAEKGRLVEATLDPFLTEGSEGAQKWIKNAPFLAVVCLEKRRALARLGEEGVLFAIEDTFMAIQNFRIAASLNDLATSVVREFHKEKMKENLGLPWYLEPLSIITAGYSHAVLEIPPRFKIGDIVHTGRWE
jgi:5,6-dimethylbenzimidazole synthase